MASNWFIGHSPAKGRLHALILGTDDLPIRAAVGPCAWLGIQTVLQIGVTVCCVEQRDQMLDDAFQIVTGVGTGTPAHVR